MEDRSLTELAADKTAAAGMEEKKLAESKKEQPKLSLWGKVKREAHHYWDGTKLLATEVRISTKLAVKMAAGYELSRRENRQLQRTVQEWKFLPCFQQISIIKSLLLKLSLVKILILSIKTSKYNHSA